MRRMSNGRFGNVDLECSVVGGFNYISLYL